MRKHPDAKCEECPLQFSGTYVPTQTPQSGQAEIAIVSGAPNYYEAERKRQLVGNPGKLLEATLRHNGIHSSDTLVTNAVSCREPDGIAPASASILACRQRLLGEIQAVGAKHVLACGNAANESLLDSVGVNRLRVGPGRTSPFNSELHIVSTLDPAAVLRAPDQVNYLSSDAAKLTLEHKEWEAPAYYVAETPDVGFNVLEALKQRTVVKVAVDIESNIDKEVDFGQPNQQELLCVGMAYDRKKVVVFGEECVLDRDFMRAFAEYVNSISKVIFQNGKFDQKGLYPLCGYVKSTGDTLLRSYVLNEYSGPHKPHSLEFLGRELVGAPDWKHDLDKYQPKKYGYGVIPKKKLYQYNAYDCDITWEVDEILEKKNIEAGVDKVHDMLVEFSNELMYMEMNGIGVNKDHLSTLGADFGEQMETIQSILEDMLPVQDKSYQPAALQKKKKNPPKYRFNPGSPNQVKALLADFGVTVGSTDEDHLKFIIAKKPDSNVAKFCQTLLKYKKASKMKGTYVDGIEKRMYAGRIYSTFLLHGTTNGRLSSRGPNLQNIPRRKIIRDLFVPVKPGNVFVQADYAQAELRILGWLAGDSYFLPIFKEGIRDVFDELTPQLLPGTTKEGVGAEAWKEIRSKRVKPFVYGLAYGRTAYGLAADPELNMEVDEAQEIMNRFTSLIPEIMEWQEKIKREVNSGNDLVSPFGRHRRFPLITDDNRDNIYREALSFLPSSTSSDIGLKALCKVRRDLIGTGWVRNFVHDSILVECAESRIEEVSQCLESRMLESGYELLGDAVSFKVDIGVGTSWGQL